MSAYDHFVVDYLIPIVALIISCVTFYLTNKTNKKVNRKDYEMSENVKYELLQLLATLESIKSKTLVAPHCKVRMNYSEEIATLRKLKVSPGYLILLQSIKDESKRAQFDLNIELIIVQIGGGCSYRDLVPLTNQIAEILQEIDVLQFSNVDVASQIKSFLATKGVAQMVKPAENEEVDEESEVIKAFTEYLIMSGCQDPDVELFYGTISNSVDVVKKAIKNGANVQITFGELVKRYNKEYQAFESQAKVN